VAGFPSRHTPRTHPGTWLGVLAGVGAVALVLAGGLLLLRLADLAVRSTTIVALQDRSRPAPTVNPTATEEPIPVPPVTNVLLVGLDTREGLTPEQLLALGTEDVGSRLTDTVVWLQYRADESRVRMLSFPRDLLVEWNGRNVKLNSLYTRGGPDLLVSHIEALVDLDLDHFVAIDLAGFIRLTDAIGGVEVCLPTPLRDVYAGIDLPAGCQVLDAYDATGFVRSRRTRDAFGEGTLGRAARQQYFLQQAVSEIVSAGTLTNPGKVRSLIDVGRSSVVVDDGLSVRAMLGLASAFRSFDPADLDGITLPVQGTRIGGEYFDVIDEEAAAPVLAALRLGRPFPEIEE
jgi:LCP family protein required for cell wall assembly